MNSNYRAIYMDHSATTPTRNEVVDAMSPYWSENFGNPSSIHRVGRKTNVVISQARQRMAELIGAKPRELIFTGSGTESDNMALRGIALARQAQGGHSRLIISAIEHHAVLHTAEDLQKHYGFSLTILPVDQSGIVSVTGFANLLEQYSDVAVVSVMHANNEIGTVQPIAQIGQICADRQVPFHTDAIQTAGKLPLHVDELNVDALSLSAHKFYGPKGVGLLYVRSGTPLQPILTGGSHENGYRAGTENVPLIVGMSKALELAEGERASEMERLEGYRNQLIAKLLDNVDGCQLTGAWNERLPHLASFVIKGVEAEGILIGLDLAGIAASSGSACTSGAQRPSHVLEAIGIPPSDAPGGLRLSLGRTTTSSDISYAIDKVTEIVQQIRAYTPAP